MRANDTETLYFIDNQILAIDGINKAERTAHQGVFKYCRGELTNPNLYGEIDSTQDLEILILEYYQFRENAFETTNEFLNYFARVWNRNISVLNQSLSKSAEFSNSDSKEEFKSKSTANSTMRADAEGRGIYSDTPNEYIEESGKGYITNITDNTAKSLNDTNANSTRDYELLRTGNEFEKWLNLSDKNKNIIYDDFIDKFAVVFSSTFVIKNYNNNRRFFK